jgi:hypothetical protein
VAEIAAENAFDVGVGIFAADEAFREVEGARARIRYSARKGVSTVAPDAQSLSRITAP